MFVSGAWAISSAPENLSEAFCQYSYLTVICICKLCILAPAVLCCFGASGELKWVYNEVIGWYISVGIIEGKKETALAEP